MKKILLSKNIVALVDDEDFDFLNQWTWCSNNGYAFRIKYSRIGKGKYKRDYIYMHRLVMKVKKGTDIDHINRIRSDNRKINLRKVTRSQNGANRKVNSNKKSTKHKGVFWCKRKLKWRVMVVKNNFI